MYVESDAVVTEPPNRTEDTPIRVKPLPARVGKGAPVPVPARGYLRVKRMLDVVLAALLLVLAAPFILVAGLLVKLTSRGPVFYSQTRVGRGGRPFTIYKIRSMYHECERASGARWSRPGDPRVMPVGQFLRRTHLDELPQLWNILRGDMSLIGPRPERPEFVPQLEQAIPRYRERLLVLPGVTGLAQVHLPPDTDLASVRRKLAFDLYYIKNIGFWGDLRLLLATAVHVFVPYVAARWFFRLNERTCVEAAGELQAPSGEDTPILTPSLPRNGVAPLMNAD
jgi:lipopolysaccharide/colanic/teichoic acid biosynthesis glycosyltransferase